ncbi:hypothetical protein NBE99_09740 [Thermosynechococcus sp. HN-54]|uniref:hypothetical protein n=1 Tax=Thermosynechococcus sp. HN-54 TaxID=2933959 RepID=UPI00202D0006|nr:hypothetical protein [Thermosynechococcus sp. HN-54]URR34917.1 hypothetical protein NBE99_09740 [Thermosynechococcus sp. HN-54]
MSDSRLLDRARQGDPRAISTLLNAVLLPKRVKATVIRQAEELMITLHSEKLLNQGAAVTLIRTALEKLHLPEIQRVSIESRVLGVPLWESHFQLQVIPPTQRHQDMVEDPWGAETAPTEPLPPEPTLLDLMSAFKEAEAAPTQPEPSPPVVSDTPEPAPAIEVVSEDDEDRIGESQESLANDLAEVNPDINAEEDISVADLAAAFDPNPPSPEPNTDSEESPSEPPPLQEKHIESNTLDGFSEELPVLAVTAESPVEESIAPPGAQASVAEIPEPAPDLSEATLEQPTLEAYDFPEPTTEDIAALGALETEISPQTAITAEMAAEAESSPEGAIAPDTVAAAPAPVVHDPWVAPEPSPSAAAIPQDAPQISQEQSPAQETISYPPLSDPWLEAAPAPEVKPDRTQQPPPTAPPETAASESEIYTIPTIEKVPRDHQSKVAGLAGMVMGLGFCATGLGAIIGLPMVVGSMWMLGDEEVWRGECPHCHQRLKVPVGKLWRFSCEKCQGLIEVKQGRFYPRATPPAPPLS